MNVNKMHIIIPKKSNNSSGQISKEDLLRNLKEITPEQLTTIDEEMRIAREKREAETEQEMRKKHGQELSSFEQKINGKKPKNLTRFFMEDSKIIENGEKVGLVLLYDYNRDYHDSFSDLEFGTKIFIKVGDFQTSKELVYRDAKDPNKDDWSKAYTKIRRLDLQGDTLRIWLGKNEGEATLYEIRIPKQNKQEESSLDLSEFSQDLFEQYIEQETEKLLNKETRNLRYPNVFGYGARSIPNLRVCEIPFDKAEIADKYQDLRKGVGYIVIKTQIDADSARGKQYSRIKYKFEVDAEKYNPRNKLDVTKDLKTTEIESVTAWEDELVNGRKIKLNAYDF